MKQNKRNRRDPYFLCKILNMVLAGAVLFLAVLILVGEVDNWRISLIFLLGMMMCALSGIMELAKSKRVIGYTCSVFAGILAVALIFTIIRMW
jgi:hypothetical protein